MLILGVRRDERGTPVGILGSSYGQSHRFLGAGVSGSWCLVKMKNNDRGGKKISPILGTDHLTTVGGGPTCGQAGTVDLAHKKQPPPPRTTIGS